MRAQVFFRQGFSGGLEAYENFLGCALANMDCLLSENWHIERPADCLF